MNPLSSLKAQSTTYKVTSDIVQIRTKRVERTGKCPAGRIEVMLTYGARVEKML